MCYTAEKSLRDAGDKVPEDLKKEIEEKVKSIRDNLQTDSVETLKQKTQELSLALQKIGEYIYKQGGQPGTNNSGSAGTGSDNGNPGENNRGEGKDNKEDEPVEGEVVE
jgi:molecular chaperone DnaK